MRVVGRLKQDRWTGPEGQTRSKVQIVAEHVEFKPQLKKQDGENTKEGEEKPESAAAEETAVDDQAEKEGELKEAASF